jgi:hypothetical protein
VRGTAGGEQPAWFAEGLEHPGAAGQNRRAPLRGMAVWGGGEFGWFVEDDFGRGGLLGRDLEDVFGVGGRECEGVFPPEGEGRP